MASQQHHQSEITAAVARTLGLGEDPDPVGVVCAVANEEQKGVMAFYDGKTKDGHGFVSSDGWSAAPAYSRRVVEGGKRKLGTDDAEGGWRREEGEQEASNNADQRNGKKRPKRVPKECRDLINDMMEDSDSDVTLAKEPISISTTDIHHPTPYDVTMNNLELRVRQLEWQVEALNRTRSQAINSKEAQDVESSNTEGVVMKCTRCGTRAPKRRKKEKKSVGCT